MSNVTHAQYNSPMPLYSRENVQEVLNQVTQYPGRSHSSMSGTFDPNQSQVYRYLQTSGQLPSAHSARYDEQHSDTPRYKGFVDPNVQSPSFKRLQYVTGVDSGAEDEISPEVHPPAKGRTEDIRASSTSRQTGATQQQTQGQGQAQPIALGYAPIPSGQQQQQQYDQQQYQQQQYQQQQHQYDQTVRTQWNENLGPPVAQKDPAAGDAVDSTFAVRIAEAERPKVPPPVVPSWTRFADRKHERWQQYGGTTSEVQQQVAAPQTPQPQYYRQPQPAQHQNPQYTLDSSRAAQDKWQAHYAPYRFEAGATSGVTERPRSRSVEPTYTTRPRYGGGKEWLKPFIAPNLRWQYGEGFAPPPRPSYSPLSSGKTYTSTTQQNYNQYYGGQTGGGISPYYGAQTGGAASPYYGTQSQQAGRTSAYDYTSTTSQIGGGTTGTTGTTGISGAVGQTTTGGSSWSKDAQSQYSRTAYESRREGGSTSQRQSQQVAPYASVLAAHNTIEEEARRQRQLMEQEVRKRAASAGPAAGRQVDTTTSTVSTANQSWRNQPGGTEKSVTTYTTTGTGPRWQQAPGSETKTQSSGSYFDPQGNKVSFTKEVFTSSDPGKEFSMLTEQERKVLEEPLQPGVISRHITTKYYKKSTFTSSTTTSTSQTPPVTTTVRQAITR